MIEHPNLSKLENKSFPISTTRDQLPAAFAPPLRHPSPDRAALGPAVAARVSPLAAWRGPTAAFCPRATLEDLSVDKAWSRTPDTKLWKTKGEKTTPKFGISLGPPSKSVGFPQALEPLGAKKSTGSRGQCKNLSTLQLLQSWYRMHHFCNVGLLLRPPVKNRIKKKHAYPDLTVSSFCEQ